jgi:hypothetical protein
VAGAASSKGSACPIGICIRRRDLWEKWLILRSRAVGCGPKLGT